GAEAQRPRSSRVLQAPHERVRLGPTVQKREDTRVGLVTPLLLRPPYGVATCHLAAARATFSPAVRIKGAAACGADLLDGFSRAFWSCLFSTNGGTGPDCRWSSYLHLQCLQPSANGYALSDRSLFYSSNRVC